MEASCARMVAGGILEEFSQFYRTKGERHNSLVIREKIQASENTGGFEGGCGLH